MDMHLVDITGELLEEPNRKGFGRGLKMAGELDDNVVALCADLTESTQIELFKNAFPERYIEIGVAEQNLVTVSSGMAAQGKIPFCASYSAFAPGRCWEQIRTTICLNDQPVKIVGAHAGVSVGPDGATHQMLEDIALMRSLPNMVVIAPVDSLEAERATLAMAADKRPNYIRLAREASPVVTTTETPFEIGKAYIYWQGHDISIISTGTMTAEAMKAAASLAKDGISAEVLHCPTIKPLDVEAVLASARKTGAVITVEEGQVDAGFGSAIAEVLSEHYPTKLRRIGMKDRYGESGNPKDLLKHFGLSANHITLAAHELLSN